MTQSRSTPSTARKGLSHRRPDPRRAAAQVVVNDLMQHGYRYTLDEPMGVNLDDAFRPELTPRELLAMGIFGGRYMTDCAAEFPEDWYATAKLCPERHDPALNYFGVNASQPLSVWRAKGWIHPDDPRGWFQWYCRYFMGRRHPDDARQIGRWRQLRRHVGQLRANCPERALDCRPRQRQALLHWAYDSRAI
jgi:hypothetical protein